MDNAISDEVRRLIAAGLSSIDHVDVLFYLRQGETTVPRLAAATRFSSTAVDALLVDLERIGLVTRHADQFTLAPVRADRIAIDELLTVYSERPVTLVRAIYRANV